MSETIRVKVRIFAPGQGLWWDKTMPRYFFDVRDGDGFHRDEIGDECADLEEAREQCQGLLPDIVRAELPDGDLHSVTCEVRDEAGRIVYRGEITYQGTRVEG